MQEKLEKGCLVIHGLTGTPVVMRSVVDRLVEAGFMVNAPLLPGHGSRPEDLAHIGWQDWWEATLEAYEYLKRRTGSVSVVGMSLGSLLALKLAMEKGGGIKAVVAMGTPLVLNDLLEYVVYPLVKFTPVRWFYKFSEKDWIRSVADAGGREFYIRHSYDRIAVNSVLEIFKLKRLVRKGLGEIVSPVLVMHAEGDDTAPLKNVEILKRLLRYKVVETMVFPRSKHVITLDYDRARAAEAAVDFLERFG